MVEGAVAAQDARTAGWFDRFAEAAPGAILGAAMGAVLFAIFGFLGWIAVSVVDLRSDVESLDARVTALEEGQKEIKERLTRLETRVDDIYARLNDIHVLLAERLPPPPEENRPQR